MQAFEANSKKKLLSVILNSISIIFKKEKSDKFQIDFYNIYIIGIDIINFHVNIFNEVVSTITLYLILLHNFKNGLFWAFQIFLINYKLSFLRQNEKPPKYLFLHFDLYDLANGTMDMIKNCCTCRYRNQLQELIVRSALNSEKLENSKFE